MQLSSRIGLHCEAASLICPEVLMAPQEAMRLQPVAANSLRRLVVRDVQLSDGTLLPAGLALELAQFSVFRNPAWGWEDPNAFKPVSLHRTGFC